MAGVMRSYRAIAGLTAAVSGLVTIAFARLPQLHLGYAWARGAAGPGDIGIAAVERAQVELRSAISAFAPPGGQAVGVALA
jgi:hypothetical protein